MRKDGKGMLDKIEYIDGKPENGVKYDLKLIRKEFRKLKIPKNVWSPLSLPLEKSNTFNLLSERAIGKTTNVLLLGAVFWKLYGTVIQYIRDSYTMIENKNIKNMLDVVRNPKYKYVEFLTDGKYTDVIYKARRWYFCNYDADGKLKDICPEHFIMCLSTDKNEVYKSTYTTEKGDFIVYDEYIRKYYNENDFFNFYDLHKTIARNRQSVFTFFLSNTIDVNSEWFDELEISETVSSMEIGDKELITTSAGTNIYIEILKPSIEKKKRNDVINRLYYGFRNPKLNSITGAKTWAVKEYQKLERDDKIIDTLAKNIYFEYYNKLIRCRIIVTQNVGIVCYCTKATGYYKDSIVFTNNFIHDKQHVYGFKDFPLIADMYRKRLFYYGTNGVGAIVEKFMKEMI